MNLYQCEAEAKAKAKDIGFDKAKFVALFPCGPVECQWLDAYMGILKINADGMRDGFVMTNQIDKQFPELYCSEPYVDGNSE